MMENGTACSENDSAVLKLIFKKKHEPYSWLRIKEQWELMGIGLYLIYSVWHSGNMTSYGNNSELSWNFPKVLLILKSRVVNYIM